MKRLDQKNDGGSFPACRAARAACSGRAFVARRAALGAGLLCAFCMRPDTAAVPRLKVAPMAPAKPSWSIAQLAELCDQQGPTEVLRSKGVALVPRAFEAKMLDKLFGRFLRLEEREQLNEMRFGDLRAERTPVHLPFQEPFSSLPLLGQDESLRDVLTEYLGDEVELESAMVIKVGPGANAQSAHMDTEDPGSLSVHVPLQPLHKDFAPLSFLLSTHDDPSILATAAPKMKRLIRDQQQVARQRQRRATAKEEHFLQWGAKEVHRLAEVDLRRGQGRCLVRGVTKASAILGLEPGDEVTHVNELDFISWLQVKDFVPDFRENLLVRVLRPIQDAEEPEPPVVRPRHVLRNQLRVWMTGRQHQDKLLVGAPLRLGDALIYDSRTVHWGMANRDRQSRYVLYLNFKRGDFQGTSPDARALNSAERRCRFARLRFREKLVRELHYLEEM